ncbi:substrate-binding domain-containing protein [Budviciaceae bacterium BWR-B9]|uniref:Substrate-binding domain-containing protein n=1 Tax=Limnobaculum allomyrinae TaxID=2791986 RepID=A0ABS1ILN5_9GAMM|nr:MULTISPECIES: substrate-binding domain-containing protein [Limnobaculum]MBK5142622.1 substrate-binding domain-containing protein [Limnobaculum allomyrinae]MBV7690492.1 substrate-binding domain-containing protein [Limnobaculum sp. M2-1]
MLNVLAAGSLRRVWTPLMMKFQAETGMAVETHFGPAGLLRQRIEAGESCDLFASASANHPAILAEAGLASGCIPFATNCLCLTVARRVTVAGDDWLSLLSNPQLRLATSTPGCDPSGDYAWQLFDNLERYQPGLGESLKNRALCLVGGVNSVAIPPGEMAASWLIRSEQAEMFLGYASYASSLRQHTDMLVCDIPAEMNVVADYVSAICSEMGTALGAFLRTPTATYILKEYGFGVGLSSGSDG